MPEPSYPRPSSTFDALQGPRADLARAIPRRPHVRLWIGLLLAVAFALVVVPTITAERLLGAGRVAAGEHAKITVRVPPFAGYQTAEGHIGGGGGVLIARGDLATRDDAARVEAVRDAMPHGAVPYVAYFALVLVLAGLFAHHTRRSTYGRLVRTQLVTLGLIAVAAIAVKLVMVTTALSVLVVPVALFAIVPTMALDRVVGLASGTLAALVVSLLVPFDVGLAILLLVQAGTAGLVVPERPKARWRAALAGGALATLLSALTYPLLVYLTTGQLPVRELHDPLHSAWLACALGPAMATALAVPLVPLYQLLVGEITHGKLVELEDLSNPLLRQIAEKSPGTWQHSLMMANMAEIAANAIGANGRLVRVGAYYHDLGKSLAPKYFIENLEPGETSPHDQLPPRVSCDAIFEHVTEGIVAARRAGLHERIIDFMHMHHGNGVLEYFWAKCQERGNPDHLTVEHFRYPGVPPQSRETAILAICDAVEAASRTLKKPDPQAIDQLVQRIVYGKLHLGQLDDSSLSMGDLRRVADSLRETIRHANHGRIEYPWQKAQQDASAPGASLGPLVSTGPRLDSLDRQPKAEPIAKPATPRESQEALATTADVATPKLRVGKPSESQTGIEATAPVARVPEDGPPTEPLRPRTRTSSQRLKIDVRTQQEATKPPVPPQPEQPRSPEAAEFAADAREVLREATKDLIARPKESAAPEAQVSDGPSARKRAATLPPTPMQLRRPPTIQPPIGRKPPTLPPLSGDPKLTLPGTVPIKPPAAAPELPGVAKLPTTLAGLPPAPAPAISSDAAITLPPVNKKPAAQIVEERDAATTQPRMDPADDPSIGDTTNPSVDVGESSWRAGLSARLEAALDDEFGAETKEIAPSKADLAALIANATPDVTKKQSLEEMERLHRQARGPHPTAEVDESDIEAAIELAPPARRTATAIGVAKKKPGE
ncbi:MAG: HDIG domain-containing metalloprotein [Acidobacteriota bacterium]